MPKQQDRLLGLTEPKAGKIVSPSRWDMGGLLMDATKFLVPSNFWQ